jgi:uncharacterized protein (UPF0548 family)
MFLVRRPSAAALARWLAEQAVVPVPPAIVPEGYTVDQYRVRLGDDAACFVRARDALRRWHQFRLGWLEVVPSTPPVRVGVTVGVLVRHLGFWSLNASRIVSVIDETDRFGFAYRTLADHAVDGDERFLVEGTADGAVVYAVRARSRPAHVLAWLGYPFARRIQRRFARDSMRALAAAVTD